MKVSLVYLLILLLALACNDDQVQTDSGCVSKCKNAFYNITAGACQSYKTCSAGMVLNETSNSCEKDCGHGYLNGTQCVCDVDWALENGICSEENSDYNYSSELLLNLNWFYWAIIIELLMCIIVNIYFYCSYKRKSKRKFPLTKV
ncbi:unnamed protein product [Blepharisma stoltei]|uniref:Uncharacterized protein n=1 Tax=Blepharisma stoltei TaxID=1481888 RepID=A0AAU9IVM8_9CILI|nr:unnamed protein product [Blepharisma stoltei]